MLRSNFLRPLSALFLLGIVPIGAACNGHVVSLGNTGDTLQPISSSTLKQAAAAAAAPGLCPVGWAHPNICCGSSSTASSCGAYEENPFTACEAGTTTYPDPLSCCQLSDPTNCMDTPADAGPLPTPPPSYGCGYVCPFGWYAQPLAVTPVVGSTTGSAGGSSSNGSSSGSSSGGSSSGGSSVGYTEVQCCIVLSNGLTQCQAQGGGVDVPVSVGCATAGTTTVTPTGSSGGTATDAGIAPTPGSIVDGGSAPTEDAGVLPGGWISDDGGCGYEEDAGSWSGYDGGAASLCSPCPAGWEPPAAGGQPELCCQSAPGGGQLCFSQATGSASGEAEDGGSAPPITGVSTPGNAGWGTAGASTDDGGSAGPSCSGSSSSCSCESSANGHSYALDCYASSSGAITCSCTIDGVATSSTPSVDSCNDSTAVENAFSQASGCGFP